jgi:hypothetical protein
MELCFIVLEDADIDKAVELSDLGVEKLVNK